MRLCGNKRVSNGMPVDQIAETALTLVARGVSSPTPSPSLLNTHWQADSACGATSKRSWPSDDLGQNTQHTKHNYVEHVLGKPKTHPATLYHWRMTREISVTLSPP
jgi:hypothetical protein